MHTGGGRERLRLKKIVHKNAIKHEKGNPLDFMTTPSTPK
jgi:hypothetical protein